MDETLSSARDCKENITQGNSARLRFQFLYVNKLPIDSIHILERGQLTPDQTELTNSSERFALDYAAFERKSEEFRRCQMRRQLGL